MNEYPDQSLLCNLWSGSILIAQICLSDYGKYGSLLNFLPYKSKNLN